MEHIPLVLVHGIQIFLYGSGLERINNIRHLEPYDNKQNHRQNYTHYKWKIHNIKFRYKFTEIIMPDDVFEHGFYREAEYTDEEHAKKRSIKKGQAHGQSKKLLRKESNPVLQVVADKIYNGVNKV